MKRALFLMLAIVMTLVAACRSNENQNQNKNATTNTNGSATSNINQSMLVQMGGTCKVVQIFVHDSKTTPGDYDIEDPGDVTLFLSYKQRVTWCVIYDGAVQSNRPDEIELNTFRSSIATNPLDDSTTDDDYHIPAAQFNENCIVVCHPPKTDVVLGDYKYTIRAWKGGVVKGQLDPRVIINS